MSDVALPLAPNLIAWLYDHARLAVQVFLVLGGYLAASSLAPQGWVRFDSAAAQIGKRFVRLMIPLPAALAVAMAAAALVRPWLEHPSVPRCSPVAAIAGACAVAAGPGGRRGALGRGVVRGHRFPTVCGYRARAGGRAHGAVPDAPGGAGTGRTGGGAGGRGRVAVLGQPPARAGCVGTVFLWRLWPGHAGVLGRAFTASGVVVGAHGCPGSGGPGMGLSQAGLRWLPSPL
jgi:hypothetical protein